MRSALNTQLEEINKSFDDEVLTHIADIANGDARQALNILEAVGYSIDEDIITLDTLKTYGSQILRYYDKNADAHYDTISAFIKSIRASKPDAAVYYLARMLSAGEDPKFVARRLLIAASEDIGMADPQALVIANAGFEAVHKIGMPEARIILAEVTVYLAEAKKSNRSYSMINKAEGLVKKYGDLEIPMHLRNAPTKFMKEHGYGEGYIYAHDDPEGADKQHYLPKFFTSRSES